MLIDREAALRLYGEPLIEGKTNIIFPYGNGIIRNFSKDDLTAGNGELHAVLPGKGRFANETTCNVFNMLKKHHLPLAYVGLDNDQSFIARQCRMLPLEVVYRQRADGSYLKRVPLAVKHGQLLRPRVELYLKTKGQRWGEHELPCDDPLMILDQGGELLLLYRPDAPVEDQEPFLTLTAAEIFEDEADVEHLSDIRELTAVAGAHIGNAWRHVDPWFAFVDCKLEFGIAAGTDTLLIGDVIHGDSWRLLFKGAHVDKQLFRQKRPLEEVERAYRFVAEMSENLILH